MNLVTSICHGRGHKKIKKRREKKRNTDFFVIIEHIEILHEFMIVNSMSHGLKQICFFLKFLLFESLHFKLFILPPLCWYMMCNKARFLDDKVLNVARHDKLGK